jgi:hypothetical protein
VFEKAEAKNWLILDVINPQKTAGFFLFYFLPGRSWGQKPQNVSDRRENISNFDLSQIYTYLSCQRILRDLAVNKRSTKHRLFCKLKSILNHL